MFKRRAEASIHQDLCGGPTMREALLESLPLIPSFPPKCSSFPAFTLPEIGQTRVSLQMTSPLL